MQAFSGSFGRFPLIRIGFSQSDHGCDFDVAWNDLKGTDVLFLKTVNYYLLTESSLLRCSQITNQFMVSDGRIWNHPIQNFSFLITRSFSRIKKTKKRGEIGPQMN